MICSVKNPNHYHLLSKPDFDIKIYDCQHNVVADISGKMPYETIKDIKDLNGLQAAKDAWWQTYLWIREEENKQLKEKGLIS